ncbi:MAG: hypothetical protein E7Z94_00050 [Actinomyces ruminicola]|uniref:Uncharacterized protein n=1 Tax=Actinomyces ruminicola TaxID=332524 RepID=A0A1H0BNB7_9ACTO|nr:hypothetical protein [Actinomyces ruminicola]SDN47068.1 hypothetical protein SAMN05216355_104125 [Actinomyces ruminicola]
MYPRPPASAPLLGARVANSRLRVGGLASAGGAVTLTQCDGTTCGATVILAARLLLGMPAPAALHDAGSDARRPGRALQETLAACQRRLQHTMNRHARGPLGPLPWTRRLGSTPWALAAELTRVLRQAGHDVAACAVEWVDDRGSDWPAVVGRLRSRLVYGTPAILLTGGPLAGRREPAGRAHRALHAALAAAPAIPRHYVLALPWTLIGRTDPGAGRVHVYEPSSGTVRALDLLAPRSASGRGPHELGGWPRVLAVIAPPQSFDSQQTRDN